MTEDSGAFKTNLAHSRPIPAFVMMLARALPPSLTAQQISSCILEGVNAADF
jgi:hypothetical protein